MYTSQSSSLSSELTLQKFCQLRAHIPVCDYCLPIISYL